MTYQVFFTGDLITPDDSDTDVYGEPTEAGHGAHLDSGWVSLDWDSGKTVYENREDVGPDRYTPDDEPPTEDDYPHDWSPSGARCTRSRPGGGGCRTAGNGDDNGPCTEHPLYPKDGDPVTWLARTLSDRLGAVDQWDGGTTFYAADSTDLDHVTGTTIRLAAHPEGFTNDELAEAARLLTGRS